MSASRQLHRRRRHCWASWWVCLFVACLIGAHLNFVLVHLATSAHVDGLFAPSPGAALHHHGDEEYAHGGEGHGEGKHRHDGHANPHAASDHSLTVSSRSQTRALLPPVLATSPQAPIPLWTHGLAVPAAIFSDIKPRREPCAGRMQPRAPPPV